MTEHRVLALKWRPAKFSDVVGQEHVVKTLTNALAASRVAHAYLFTGPRGVGKTTCARILAKAVNCEKGAGPNPCGTCSMCAEITEGRALDVIEIDAASTGKADDIRDLKEVVRLAPARARRKVFIIDEVHSMSAQAFNALLKTLEEPPPHVLFVLATTEVLKVPATIHSRCQRFDFHPLGPATIVSHLKKIASVEKLEVDGAALALIAKAARGAMRDAQMLLEQSAAYASGTGPKAGQVTATDVRNLLGLIEGEWVEKFLTVLHDRRAGDALKLLDELIEAGRSPDELLSEVQEELRDGLMTRLGAGVTALSGSGFLIQPERKDWFNEEELLSLLGHVRRAMDEVSSRYVIHPRVAAELAVARLMRREHPLSWAEVEAQISRLEAGTGARGNPGPPGNPSPAQGVEGAQKRTEPIGLKDPEVFWAQALERLRTANPSVHIYLKDARLAGMRGDILILESASPYFREGLKSAEMKATAETALSSLAGRRLGIEARPISSASPESPGSAESVSTRPATSAVTNDDAGGGVVGSPGGSKMSPSKPASEPMSTPDWLNHEPLVKSSLELFKGRIVDHKKGPKP